MLRISVKYNLSALENSFRSMQNFVGNSAIKIAADIEISDILARTAIGNDANDKRFPQWSSFHREKPGFNYSPSHKAKRRKLGLQTSRKDLRITNALLQSLYYNGKDMVTVKDEFEAIARGQMENPNWKYHHLFLLHGDKTTPKQEKAIANGLQSSW